MQSLNFFLLKLNKIYSSGFQFGMTTFLFLIWLTYHQSIAGLTVLLVAFMTLVLALFEWLSPAHQSWILTKRELVKDLFYQAGVYFLYGPFFASVSSQICIDHLGVLLKENHFSIWPNEWPLLAKIFLVLVSTEFFAYWFHRAEHRFSFLWRLHSVHHSPNKMGWTKNVLNHPIEYFILVMIGVLPAAFFGAETLELEGAVLIYLVTTLFAHCNLKLNDSIMSPLFVTNRYHFRHHSPVLKESLSNYGCALVIWDRIFGTYRGLTQKANVGIEPGEDLSLLQELTLPFRSMQINTGIELKQ